MSKEISENLIDSLNTIYAEVQSGTTFFQSINDQDLPKIKCSKSLIKNWISLRNAIVEGKCSALETLKVLIEELRSQKKILLQLKKKTQGPLIQMYISSLCGVVLTLYLFWQSQNPDFSLKISTKVLLFSALAQIISYIISFSIIKNFKKRLRYLDWIQFTSRILLSLKWGQSLHMAYKESLKALNLELLPVNTRVNIVTFSNYLTGKLDTPKFKTNKQKIWTKSEHQLKCLYKLYNDGNSLTPFLKLSLEDSYRDFQYYMECESEKVSYQLLIPLFLLQVPAFMLILLYPLWDAMKNF